MFPLLQQADGSLFDQIHLTGLQLNCVIGIYPRERRRKQPLRMDLCFYLSTAEAATTGNLQHTIDYAQAVSEIEFLLKACRFQLLETACEALCHYLLAPVWSHDARASSWGVFLKLSKPGALLHGVVPAVQVVRKRQELQWTDSRAHGLAPMILHRSKDCTIRHYALEQDHELVLEGLPDRSLSVFAMDDLLLAKRLLKKGTSFVCDPGDIFKISAPHKSSVVVVETKSIQL